MAVLAMANEVLAQGERPLASALVTLDGKGHGVAKLGFDHAPGGPTALTAIGSASGKHYRFDRPGARVAVEPMDEVSLRGVPNLRQVSSP